MSGSIARDGASGGAHAIEFIEMIGVRPEGADGAGVHVIGREIDPAGVRGSHDLGVSTGPIRGFDPPNDGVEYGHEPIPLVRREAARRDRAAD